MKKKKKKVLSMARLARARQLLLICLTHLEANWAYQVLGAPKLEIQMPENRNLRY